MPATDKIIELDAFCSPIQNPTDIGHQARNVVWRRTDGTAVTNVAIQGDASDFDLPGQRVGNDYRIHYNGSDPQQPVAWNFSANCQAGNSPKKTAPQMTNGGGG